jgi:hypothetical protein
VPKPTLAHLINHLVGKREQQTPFVSMKLQTRFTYGPLPQQTTDYQAK